MTNKLKQMKKLNSHITFETNTIKMAQNSTPITSTSNLQ